MTVDSVETLLGFFVTASSILFGFYGVIFSLYCSFILNADEKRKKSEGNSESDYLPIYVIYMGRVCKNINLLLQFTFSLTVISLLLYSYLKKPHHWAVLLLCLGLFLIIIFMALISRNIAQNVES